MNRLIILILALLLWSCNERSVQLPQLSQAQLPTEVTDYSPIYIFFNENSGLADLNRKNMISTTHWVFNIDKRLPLSEVGKTMLIMQKKRATMSFHSNPDAKNYFTIADMHDHKYKFLEFTTTQFEVITEIQNQDKILEISDLKNIKHLIETLKANPSETISMDGSISFQDFVVFLQKIQEVGLFFKTITILDIDKVK